MLSELDSTSAPICFYSKNMLSIPGHAKSPEGSPLFRRKIRLQNEPMPFADSVPAANDCLKQVRESQAQLFQQRKLSANSVGQHLAALRFLYIKTLRRPWSLAETPYPKKEGLSDPGSSGSVDLLPHAKRLPQSGFVRSREIGNIGTEPDAKINFGDCAVIRDLRSLSPYFPSGAESRRRIRQNKTTRRESALEVSRARAENDWGRGGSNQGLGAAEWEASQVNCRPRPRTLPIIAAFYQALAHL